MGREHIEPGQPLSRPEGMVLLWASTGMTNRAIARELGYSEGQVANWLHQAYRKLRAQDRTQAVIAALIRGDIKIPAIPDPATVLAATHLKDVIHCECCREAQPAAR